LNDIWPKVTTSNRHSDTATTRKNERSKSQKRYSSRMNFRPYFFAACAWIGVSLNAHSAEILHRGNGTEPDSLDPQRSQSLSAQNILRDLFEGLTREDASGNIEPGLAARWQRSDDALTWRFYLRTDIFFSNGQPIKAVDVRASLLRALRAETAAPYSAQLMMIKGASAVQNANKDAEANFGVRAIDDNIVEIQLTQPTPNLPARLSLPVAAIIPVAHIQAMEASKKQWTRTEHMITSGAYRLIAWRPLSSVQLEANPHYYESSKLAIREVHYHVTEDTSEEARRFEAGELHITETIPPGRKDQLVKRFGSKLRIAPSLGTFYLGLNLTQAPLKDNLALRQALSLAIDRNRIVQIVTGTGERAAYGLLPPQLRGTLIEVARSNLELERHALALYQKAGYSKEKPLTIELRYNTSVLNRRLMLAISVMWEQVLGVRTILRQEEMKVLVQNRKARRITQAFRGGWNADLADPLDFLDLFDSQSPLNTSGFQSSTYMQLLQQLRVEHESIRARQLAIAAETELLKAQPIIPLFFYTSKHLVSDKVANYIENPLDHHPTRVLAWRP
jgi:oligopeptide transport system substrate-binding protein